MPLGKFSPLVMVVWTPAGVISITCPREVPISVTKTSPAPSTATPVGISRLVMSGGLYSARRDLQYLTVSAIHNIGIACSIDSHARRDAQSGSEHLGRGA